MPAKKADKTTDPVAPEKKPNIKYEVRKLADLMGAEYNPRTISSKAMKGLTASLQRFGNVEVIVVNQRTGTVIGGHQRIKALRALGETEVMCSIVDLSESEEKALNVTLNNFAIQGQFTDDLDDILASIKTDLPDYFPELRFTELEVPGAGLGLDDVANISGPTIDDQMKSKTKEFSVTLIFPKEEKEAVDVAIKVRGKEYWAKNLVAAMKAEFPPKPVPVESAPESA